MNTDIMGFFEKKTTSKEYEELNEVILSYGNTLLNFDSFKKVKEQFDELETLKDLNITNNNYSHKVKSYLKNKISLHRGIPKGKKLSFIDFYLMNLGKRT